MLLLDSRLEGEAYARPPADAPGSRVLILGIGNVLFRCFAIPLDGFTLVFVNALAVEVAVSKTVLGFGIALFRRLAIPLGRFT